MLAIIQILLNIHLLPLPMDQTTTPDARQIAATQITVEDDLAIFSENFFDLPFEELTLKNHSSPADMAETGLVENGIYFVYDRSGDALGVLKIMPTSDYDDELMFEDEYTALDELRQYSFKHFHLVNLFGRAHGEVNGEDTLVLAESIAPGKSINQLIKNYAKMSSGSGKTKALGEIKDGVRETALAMAELHKKFPKLSSNPTYLSKYSGYLPGPYGLIHGDAHPGNIFYDKESGHVTFIDFQMTPDLSEGGPVGYDLANFIITVDMLGKYKNIPANETDALIDEFLSNYQANGPAISLNDIKYYQTKIYERYANLPEEEITGPDSGQARFIHDYCVEKLALNT